MFKSNGIIDGGINYSGALGAYRFTYMVDPIYGSNSNDGKSWTSPFLTIQKAIDTFMADKHALGAGVITPPVEIYGQNAIIYLAAGDYTPADDTSPIIEIPSWSADTAVGGGGWGLTIAGVEKNCRAILEGGATNTAPLALIAGARGIRLLNIAFHRGLKTAGIADVTLTDGDEVINKPAASAAHHPIYFEIAGCSFLGDLAADGESSTYAILCKDGKFGWIHNNIFDRRASGTGTATGIYMVNDNGNPGNLVIEHNTFRSFQDSAIQYAASASIQNLEIRYNTFKRDSILIAGGALTMRNAVAIPNGKGVGYQPVLNDNRFMGWAALDNTANTDALYDVEGTATIVAGTDYMGNDTTNLIGS